jgi:hypothetical protein
VRTPARPQETKDAAWFPRCPKARVFRPMEERSRQWFALSQVPKSGAPSPHGWRRRQGSCFPRCPKARHLGHPAFVAKPHPTDEGDDRVRAFPGPQKRGNSTPRT